MPANHRPSYLTALKTKNDFACGVIDHEIALGKDPFQKGPRIPPRKGSFPKIPVIDMELVEHSMQKRREHDPHDGDEHKPAKKRIRRREHFCAESGQPVDRPHAPQDHRRIQERIDPIQSGTPMISGDPET
jgi:hypothetical protein